jgi:hypothetical protein
MVAGRKANPVFRQRLRTLQPLGDERRWDGSASTSLGRRAVGSGLVTRRKTCGLPEGRGGDEIYDLYTVAAGALTQTEQISETNRTSRGKAPDIWAAAVEEYGIIDRYTMLQHSNPLLQEYEKSLLGDPVKDRVKYEAASPI